MKDESFWKLHSILREEMENATGTQTQKTKPRILGASTSNFGGGPTAVRPLPKFEVFRADNPFLEFS